MDDKRIPPLHLGHNLSQQVKLLDQQGITISLQQINGKKIDPTRFPDPSIVHVLYELVIGLPIMRYPAQYATLLRPTALMTDLLKMQNQSKVSICHIDLMAKT